MYLNSEGTLCKTPPDRYNQLDHLLTCPYTAQSEHWPSIRRVLCVRGSKAFLFSSLSFYRYLSHPTGHWSVERPMQALFTALWAGTPSRCPSQRSTVDLISLMTLGSDMGDVLTFLILLDPAATIFSLRLSQNLAEDFPFGNKKLSFRSRLI